MIFWLPVPLKRYVGERTKVAYADSDGLKTEKGRSWRWKEEETI